MKLDHGQLENQPIFVMAKEKTPRSWAEQIADLDNPAPKGTVMQHPSK